MDLERDNIFARLVFETGPSQDKDPVNSRTIRANDGRQF